MDETGDNLRQEAALAEKAERPELLEDHDCPRGQITQVEAGVLDEVRLEAGVLQ